MKPTRTEAKARRGRLKGQASKEAYELANSPWESWQTANFGADYADPKGYFRDCMLAVQLCPNSPPYELPPDEELAMCLPGEMNPKINQQRVADLGWRMVSALAKFTLDDRAWLRRLIAVRGGKKFKAATSKGQSIEPADPLRARLAELAYWLETFALHVISNWKKGGKSQLPEPMTLEDIKDWLLKTDPDFDLPDDTTLRRACEECRVPVVRPKKYRKAGLHRS